jgi:hypothetical protein
MHRSHARRTPASAADRVCSSSAGGSRGEIVFWTAGPGTGGQPPVGLDELELAGIDPLPSWVCCQDMADFAEFITDERAGPRLVWAIQGRGAFRRFMDELRDEYPDLLPAWYAFRDVRARRRAIQ